MTANLLKNAILSEKIDWIAYSMRNNNQFDFPTYIDAHWKKIPPLRNYTNGEENKQGVKRFWNTENTHQGKLVILSGAASAILQDNQLDFLRMVNTRDLKPTRIDYALDITHSRIRPQTATKFLRLGEAVTHAQSAIVTKDEFRGGYTQYVGTKSSETYTRIYDKSKEQKADYPWVRFETVYQGDRAKASLQAYLQCGSTRPLIKRHIDFPGWSDFQTIMHSPVVKLRAQLRETNTRHWLLTQVAKSMAKELSRDEEHDLWFQFSAAVKRELMILEPKCDILDSVSKT